jgi:hypothetical protein
MKRCIVAFAAALAIFGLSVSAQAAPWRSINERQEELDKKIDKGVNSGNLSKSEAGRLRAEFKSIARLEDRYRDSGKGLDGRERRDLDRRFDRLAVRIKIEKQDKHKKRR